MVFVTLIKGKIKEKLINRNLVNSNTLVLLLIRQFLKEKL